MALAFTAPAASPCKLIGIFPKATFQPGKKRKIPKSTLKMTTLLMSNRNNDCVAKSPFTQTILMPLQLESIPLW